MTHRLLKRQLRKLGLDEQSPPTPEQWQEFLRRVERTYTESDKDRYLLERSMTISSQEMQRLYKQLQEASETQIAAERDKLQAVLSSVGEGLCAYDANGELMFINPAAEAILGWSEAELRAQQTPLLDLIRVEPEIPTASLLTNDQILEKLHTGTPYRNDDGLFRRQDGSVFPASYLFNPVLKNGVYQGFVLVFRDITAWKQANEAVRVSETRYRDLFENANDLIQSVAPDGSFLYVNRAWLETLGYSAEEVHDLNLKDIVHPDCEALCVESFQRVMQGEAVSGLEITFVTKDGRSIIVEGNASASFDESGHPVATRGIFRDITERKRAEAELEKSLSLLQATFEAVADGILAVDQHGKVLALNQKYIDMWQIPSDIVATKNDNDLLAAMLEQVKDPERFIARIQKLYNSPETESIDIIELKDGRIFEQYTTPQYIGDKIVGRVWNYRDITTKTLTEQALRRAKEEAEAANRAKSAFLASMSHELRTPLAAIIGYSELLQELTDVDDDILAPRLQKIEVSANHLLSLISDILDMSKIEAGKIELFYETFSTQSLLEDVLVTAQPLMEKNGNTLVLDWAKDLGTIHADATRLRQILLNLLSNAAKFTENGRITFHASRKSTETGREWLIFKVSDTGIGMTENQLAHIFEPFIQADNSTSRKYGGSGLGLAISQRFCQMMGGYIDVESVYGQGSTFTVYVPARPISLENENDTHRWESGEARETATPTPISILVIDDDPATREFLTTQLTKEGFDVITASTGTEGLELARKHSPSAITLDILMPDIDGWSVLATLKNDPTLQDIPVILVSITHHKQKGFSLGATDYLLKPVNIQQLTNVLRKHHLSTFPPSHILVIEDSPEMRDYLRLALESQGYTVSEATNGREGLAKLAKRAPDIILLDLMMPHMNGFQFLDVVHRNPKWHKIPVIVLTAVELSSMQRETLNRHVKSIIQKGAYSSEALISEIRNQILFYKQHKQLKENRLE